MKIRYANPAPDEDLYPGEAVHMSARGNRYFDYKDLWFEQLDRHYVLDQILRPLDRSVDGEAMELMAGHLGVDERGRLRGIGLVCQDLGLARQMIDRRMDFVFDCASGLFFFDLRGKHEYLMECLWELHTGDNRCGADEAAERYVMEGRGMFRSSQSPRLMIGPHLALPAWAKTAALQVHRMEGP